MKMFHLLGSKNLDLPYSNDVWGIERLLKEKFNIFIKELKEFNQVHYSENMENTIEDIKISTEGIISAIHKYLLGDITGACITFNNVVEKSEFAIKRISEYYGKYVLRTYYRARLRSDKKENFDKKEDFFHIPFESRHLVKNQRYSVSGFPCMYLGTTPYTCYEELGRPKAQDMYFTKIEIPKDYNLITIGLLPYELKKHLCDQNNADNEEIIINYLKMIPIIMACSVKVDVSKKKGVFKEEYIVPQLITQWLITSDRSFDGILYFSTATRTHSRLNYRLYQNLVLPVKEIGCSGYCKKLLKEIKLTFPISASGIEFFKEYDHKYFQDYDYLDKLPGNGRIGKDNNSEIHYSASGFRLLEFMLSQKECSTIA